jgi:hypothetical protein
MIGRNKPEERTCPAPFQAQTLCLVFGEQAEPIIEHDGAKTAEIFRK